MDIVYVFQGPVSCLSNHVSNIAGMALSYRHRPDDLPREVSGAARAADARQIVCRLARQVLPPGNCLLGRRSFGALATWLLVPFGVATGADLQHILIFADRQVREAELMIRTRRVVSGLLLVTKLRRATGDRGIVRWASEHAGERGLGGRWLRRAIAGRKVSGQGGG